MKKPVHLIVFIFLLQSVILLNNDVNAQCCSAGNPAGGDILDNNLKKGEWLTDILFRYSLSDDYFNKSKKTDVPLIDCSYYDYFNFKLGYGISNKISLHSELGYFLDKAQQITSGGEEYKINANGLGDLLLEIRYRLFSSPDENHLLNISGGVKVPIGAFNETQDGVYIPISLQPSSGTLKYNLSMLYLYRKKEKKYGLLETGSIEWSNIIEKDFLVYQYGPLIKFSSGFFYSIQKQVTATSLIKYELRGHDKREDDITIESTGSHLVLFNPVFSFGYQDWKFIVQADVPVYKYVNGYQLTNKFAYQVGLRKKFNKCLKK